MRIGRIVLCAVGIFLMWSGSGVAAEGADHICFRRVDADKNGKVTFQEFMVHYGKDKDKFNAADLDGDGLLIHDEYHDFLGHGKAEKNGEK